MDLQTVRQVKDQFLSDLYQSSSGQNSSLLFIRHHVTTTPLVKSGDIIQVLVIGGTNFQKALIQKVDNQARIISHEQELQPQFATKADLMTFLATHIDPNVEVVAINFAYPLTPSLRNGMLEGTLESGSKENTFDGLVGESMGEEIETHMKHVHKRTIRVAVGNDVICLLLSGLNHHRWDAIAAGIVGTGLNLAMFLDKDTCVNIESANFNHFPQSETGKEIDRLSASPGTALYEKEVSGAYLYQYFNILAKKQDLPIQNINSSEQLNLLTHHGTRDVARLAREVLDHSASLASAQIAGILEFSKRDLTFIMQGSLYWRGNGYKESVENLVTKLVPDYHASYEHILNSDLIGAAELVI